MLTQLRFKNWRTLRDATIKLEPITVFIGTNSSGKTNMLDGLHFLRSIVQTNPVNAVLARNGYPKIATQHHSDNSEVSVGFEATLGKEKVEYTTRFEFLSPDNLSFNYTLNTRHGSIRVTEQATNLPHNLHLMEDQSYWQKEQNHNATVRAIERYIVNRWQMLDANFTPPVRTPREGNLYYLERRGENLVTMLTFMRQYFPKLHAQLEFDLRWILDLIEGVSTEEFHNEIEMMVTEKHGKAPTVSTGTAQVVAMLMAFYALEFSDPHAPGLVVIEEPVNSLHPWLLK